MASNAAWGVEIGSGSLKAVKLAREGEGVQVLEAVIIPHKRPLSAPDIDVKDAIRVALGTLVSQHDLSKATIAISVAGSQSFARFAKLPPVEKNKVPDIVRFEAVQQIPFPIDEVQWDYQTFVSPDSPEVEVGIFAVRTENVMDVLSTWQDVNKTPDILTLSPLAAYNAIAYDQQFSETTPGTVILDVGTTSTDLIIAEGGRMWIRTFPKGGHDFTEALVTGFNISYVKAEKLKGEAESSQHARQILQAMRPVFGDLAQDVQRSINYYQTAHKDARLTRVIGLGATFQLPGLRKFLSQQLGMEVSKLEKFTRVTKYADGKEQVCNEHAAELATAFGLAIQGLGVQTIDANLMPVSVVREAMWKDKTKWFVAAASVALLAGAAMWLKPVLDSSAMGSTPPPLVREVRDQAKQLKNEWQKIDGQSAGDARAAGLFQLVEARDLMPRLVADAGQMLAAGQAKGSSLGNGPQPGGVELVNLRTEYLPPAAPADGSTPAADAGRGTVRCVATIKINRESATADAFVARELAGWLRANADRSDTPYQIRNAAWRYVSSSQVGPDGKLGEMAGPGAGGGAGGGGAAGGGFGGPGARPVLPEVPREERGGGRRPVSRPVPPAGGGGTLDDGGGSGGGWGGGGGGGSNPAGDAGLEAMAPIPDFRGMAVPGATITTYEITWDAVLGAKQEAKQ